jgi:hypothetical protein
MTFDLTGYSPGVTVKMELVVDGSRQPAFFDADDNRLVRVWGVNKISDGQLQQMRLTRTDLKFPRGYFCRPGKK